MSWACADFGAEVRAQSGSDLRPINFSFDLDGAKISDAT